MTVVETEGLSLEVEVLWILSGTSVSMCSIVHGQKSTSNYVTRGLLSHAPEFTSAEQRHRHAMRKGLLAVQFRRIDFYEL